jgi:hypothetical protein
MCARALDDEGDVSCKRKQNCYACMNVVIFYRVVEEWDAADSTHDTPSEVVVRVGQGR